MIEHIVQRRAIFVSVLLTLLSIYFFFRPKSKKTLLQTGNPTRTVFRSFSGKVIDGLFFFFVTIARNYIISLIQIWGSREHVIFVMPGQFFR